MAWGAAGGRRGGTVAAGSSGPFFSACARFSLALARPHPPPHQYFDTSRTHRSRAIARAIPDRPLETKTSARKERGSTQDRQLTTPSRAPAPLAPPPFPPPK